MNSRLIRKLMVFLLGLLLLAVPTGPASAHRPDSGNDEGITMIDDPDVSYAFYRAFDKPNQVHVYQFEGQKGRDFHAGINIPQIARLKHYGVTLALIGPGLPALDAETASTTFGFYQLPEAHLSHGENGAASHDSHSHAPEFSAFTLPEEIDLSTSGAVVQASQHSGDFFEPFTMTSYWSKQEINLSLPESGTYYLVVWNHTGEPGKYVMDTGRLEVFGTADLFNFPVWLFQTHLYFENYLLLIGVPALVAVVLAFRWIRRQRLALPVSFTPENSPA